MSQPAFSKKNGPNIKHWEPVTPIPKKVRDSIDIVNEVLADGAEHHSSEFKDIFEEHGILFRYFHAATKEIRPTLKVVNRGRAGAFYKLKHPQTPVAVATKKNPEVAVSARVAQKSAPVGAQTLRDKVNDAVPGYDPIVAIAEIANDQSTPVAVRLECHRDVAKYMVPQVKAVEITSDDQPIALSFKWEGD